MSSKRKRTGSRESKGVGAGPGTGQAEGLDPARVEAIRLRAYEIFRERGEQPGRELDDWFEAERQLHSDVI
jgi:hypothetical protein